jgi:hypothetical protein
MPVSQYLPFGTGGVPGSPNTLSYAAYSALTTVIGNGFQSGTAESNQFNTLMRQVSVGVAALASFVATHGVEDVLDNGDVVEFRTNLKAALDALYILKAKDLDYRQAEGTWSPFVNINGSSSGIVALGTPAGSWVRVRGMVFYEGFFNLSSKGSSTGGVSIVGLPFTPAGGHAGGLLADDMSLVSGDIRLNTFLEPGPPIRLQLRKGEPAGDGPLLQNTDITDDSVFYVWGHYRTTDAWPP